MKEEAVEPGLLFRLSSFNDPTETAVKYDSLFLLLSAVVTSRALLRCLTELMLSVVAVEPFLAGELVAVLVVCVLGALMPPGLVLMTAPFRPFLRRS